MNEIKIVFTDIDGVWTDAGMYYDELGNELKKFNTYDSAGVLFLRHFGIKTAIVTGENTKAVEKRAKKLQIDYVFQGCNDKLSIVKKVCKEEQIEITNVAYIGDDINDYECLEAIETSAAPSSAPRYIREITKLQLTKKGGEGAFREFAEIILDRMGKMDSLRKQKFKLNLSQ